MIHAKIWAIGFCLLLLSATTGCASDSNVLARYDGWHDLGEDLPDREDAAAIQAARVAENPAMAAHPYELIYRTAGRLSITIRDVAYAADGDLVASGYANDTNDQRLYMQGNINHPPWEGAVLLRFDPEGRFRWGRLVSGGNRDDFRSILAMPDNSVVVSTRIRSSIFNEFEGVLAKFDAEGFPVWIKRFSSPEGSSIYAPNLISGGDILLQTTGRTVEIEGVETGRYLMRINGETGEPLWSYAYTGLGRLRASQTADQYIAIGGECVAIIRADREILRSICLEAEDVQDYEGSGLGLGGPMIETEDGGIIVGGRLNAWNGNDPLLSGDDEAATLLRLNEDFSEVELYRLQSDIFLRNVNRFIPLTDNQAAIIVDYMLRESYINEPEGLVSSAFFYGIMDFSSEINITPNVSSQQIYEETTIPIYNWVATRYRLSCGQNRPRDCTGREFFPIRYINTLERLASTPDSDTSFSLEGEPFTHYQPEIRFEAGGPRIHNYRPRIVTFSLFEHENPITRDNLLLHEIIQ